MQLNLLDDNPMIKLETDEGPYKLAKVQIQYEMITFGSVYEYYGKGVGYVGSQFSAGHWFEILKPRVIEGSEALQSL